jgi:hypothetical protein
MTNLTDLLPAGAGGKQVSFTASGAISSGQAVALQSDGTVTSITGKTGSSYVFASANTGTYASVFDSNSNKVVIAYQDNDNSGYGTAVVATVSGSTISYGTPVVFESASSSSISIVFDSSNNKVVISYQDAGNGYYGTSVVGTVSGTSITFGTPVVFASAFISTPASTFDSNANRVVIAFGEQFSSYAACVVGTVSGTSISFGTKVNLANYGLFQNIVFDSTNNKVIILNRRDSDNLGEVYVGTVSGTSISYGTPVTYSTSSVTRVAAVFDSNSGKVVIAYDQGDTGTAIVGAVSGTSISFGSERVFTNVSVNIYTNNGTFDSTNNVCLVLFKNDSTGYQEVVELSVSGTTTTQSGPFVVLTQTVSVAGRSIAYDSNANKSVLAYSDGSNSNYGTAVVYDTDGATSTDFIGIADAAISDTASGSVTIKGGVASNTDISTPLVTTVNDDAYWMTTGAPQAIAQVYDPDSSKFVVIGRDGNIPRAFVGTVSGTSISYGSLVYPGGTISGAFFNQSLTYDTNADKLVFCYQNVSNSYYGTAVVGSISGTTTTWGTPVVYASVNSGFNEVVYDSNAQKVAVFYKNQSSSNQGVAIVGTVSGTSISFGSSTDFLASNTNDFALAYDTNAQKIFVAVTDYGASLGRAYVATISGTSISFGTPTTFLSDVVAGTSLAAAYDSTNQKCVLAYTNETTDLGYIVVGTISGTSVSFGSATQYAVGLSDKPNINCMAYNPTSQLINIVYNMPSGADDGIRTTFASISGTTVTVESDVSLKTGGNTEMSGNLYDPDTGNIIVFYNDPSVSDAVSNVLTATTTLVPNSTYYVQSDGTLSTTSSSVTAGKALSATSINLDYTT